MPLVTEMRERLSSEKVGHHVRTAVAVQAMEAIQRYAPIGSRYLDRLSYLRSSTPGNDVAELVELVDGLARDYNAGRLVDPGAEARGAVFQDFLDIADSLLNDERGRAPGLAAFTAGLVLEDHLRKLAELHGIPTTEGGRSKRAGRLVDDLQKKKALTLFEANDVKELQSVRNDGAHWLDKVEEHEAREAIGDVKSFLAKHPA